MKKGKLYLIPAPLGETNAAHTVPPYVVSILQELNVLIAERAKTARHFIKILCPGKSLDITIHELNEHTPPADVQHFLEAAIGGQDIGLMSEAGAPGVADPGATVVWMAHQQGIEVVPLVGPSAILLALMASGMNGQSFCFHGYLSPKRPDLEKDLKRLENLAIRLDQTQIFIETPYRNGGMIETALRVLTPSTRLCIAADLTLPTEWVRTATIQQWRAMELPALHKRPVVFLLYAV